MYAYCLNNSQKGCYRKTCTLNEYLELKKKIHIVIKVDILEMMKILLYQELKLHLSQSKSIYYYYIMFTNAFLLQILIQVNVRSN